jgi:acyl-CoA thioesterase
MALHLEGDTTGMISLDHTAWFHRPARADDRPGSTELVNAAGCAPALRDPNAQGLIVAPMAQEMLLQPVAQPTMLPG